MKKLFLTIICAVLSIGARAQFSGSGNGTEADPYRIYTDIHLAQMANFLNQEGVVFELMKDVDLSAYISENSPSQGWTPIGVESTPFKGVLKGNNHTISGLFINRASTDNVGLFGCLNGASISDICIKSSNVTGQNFVGVLCGSSYSKCLFTNCKVEITGKLSGLCDIGGIVGYMHDGNTIADCDVKGAVESKAGSTFTCGTIGGIGGTVESAKVSNCTYNGSITAKVKYAGGLIGSIHGCSLSDCTVKSPVDGDESVGGLCGIAEEANTIQNCRQEGNVSGAANVSGGVGLLFSGSDNTFNNCHHKGKIINTGDYTGGIVGKSEGACIAGMSNCSHFGDIEGKDYVGGLVGRILEISQQRPRYYDSTSSTSNTKSIYHPEASIAKGQQTICNINNCAAIGNILGSSFVGGIVGEDNACVEYVFSSTGGKDISGTSGTYWWRSVDGGVTYTYTGKKTTHFSPLDKETIKNTSINNSYFSGNILGKENVGGIAGVKMAGEVINNYVNAIINGEKNVGGIIGNGRGTNIHELIIKSNVAINSNISASSSNVGRIYGNNANTLVTIGALASPEGNRALTQTSVMLCGVAQDIIDDEQNGTSVGPSMLKLKANYVSWGWNFDDNWNILETECYPYKKYQAAPPVIESKLESQATNISGQSLNGGTVYLYYKDRDAVSTACDGHNWSFDTDALQSGAQVQLYADVEGMTPSYLTSATVKYPGSGTEDDPYRIYTAEDLQGASNSGYYKVMNDIDLTTWINENSPKTGWPAIGRNSTVATYINGDGHKITGLWINTTEGYNGLFSNYSAGYIKNLNVEVANGKKVKGGDYTGVLIGRMANGQIINCSVKGSVEGTVHIGGVSGYVDNSTVSNVSFDGTVSSSSANAFVGGIAGSTNNVEMTSCNTSATVSSTAASSNVGGLVGMANGGFVSKSYVNANITVGGSTSNVGGLIGKSVSPITMCYSTGKVTANGADSYTGGLVGYTTAKVEDSYSTADVTGTLYSAGLVAYTFSTIANSYASGNIKGEMYGAGVVGELDGESAGIINSVALNNKLELSAQSSWGCRVIGGFKNGCAEPDNSNYALNTMQVSLNNVPQKKTDDNIEGIAKTADQLKTSALYESLDWDFYKTWAIEESASYPYLLWEVDVNPIVDIALDKTSLILPTGNTYTLEASILPLSATNKRVTWTTSNSAIAIVEDGVVTAIGQGTATITATTTDGSNLSATCTVTVVANQDDVIAELQTLVDKAQALYDNSKEGNNIGQYAPGSRAALLSAIRDVKSQISSTMSADAISSCTTTINNAIETFKSKMVSAGEDTDITQYDNVVYVNSVEGRPGSQVTLSVQMNNADPVYGYEFRLYLPAGVTVATETDAYGDTNPMVTLTTGRTSAIRHTFESSINAEGMLTVLCYSTKKYTFVGNSGEVAQIVLDVADNVEAGDYPIIIKGEAISLEGLTPEIDYIKSTLTISDFKLGDANGDTKVNVGDITTIAGYILGSTSGNFVFKGADANEDNKVNVGDITAIAGMILNGTANSVKSRMAMSVGSAQFGLADAIVARGGEIGLPVYVKNSESAFSSFQFDVNVPEGFKVKGINANANRVALDYLQSAEMENGVCRVLGYSLRDRMVRGTEGAVVYLTLSAEDVKEGTYDFSISNGVFAQGNSIIESAEVKATITVADATAIFGIASADQQVTVYDVNGRAVKSGIKASDCLDGLSKGIYIVNGVKIVK